MISPADNIGYLCSPTAKSAPDKTAIIDFPDGAERKTTYGELENRLNRAAQLFRQSGLSPGERIAIGVGNRREFIEALFGAMRCGLTPVPINIKLGKRQLAHILQDANCRAAALEAKSAAHLAELPAAATMKSLWFVDKDDPDDWNAALSRQAAFAPEPLEKTIPAMQPYTSGSTGLPKGVIVTHAGSRWFLNALKEIQPGLTQNAPVALIAVPLFHKNAMAAGVKAMLSSGGTLVIQPGFEADAFVDALARYGCTYTTGAPAMYAMALQALSRRQALSFPKLRFLIVGSAPCPLALLLRIEKGFGKPVMQGYGLTEGGPVVFLHPENPENYGLKKVPPESCGVPVPGCEVKLVGEDGTPAKKIGELHIRNPGVTPCYWNLPKLTAERLQDGWLKTGDLFEKSQEGLFYFRGRVDDMFICGGENIYPLEVENTLLAHQGVANACVVPVDHALKGKAPAAMVTLKEGQTLTADALKAHCLENGPAYAHPRWIEISRELPLTGAGKIDRQKVADILRRKTANLSGFKDG